MERNLTHSTIKVSVVGHRLSVYRCDCGSVRANQHLLFFVNLSSSLVLFLTISMPIKEISFTVESSS